MSINGVLEDMPLADVLQFVHLARRTGTLYMWRDDEHRAEIGFHDGKIVSAWTPGQKRLGDLLVDAGHAEPAVIARILEKQQEEGARLTLGQMLLERELVSRSQIHGVIRDQVQKTVFELVTWRHGNFHFEIDELHPVDDFSLAPGDVLDDLDLNTQMLLLEATRIFDERSRGEIAPAEGAEKTVRSNLDRRLERAGFARGRPGPRTVEADRDEPGANGTPALEAIRCQVASDDSELLGSLHERLPAELVKVVPIRLREAGTRLPGETASPIVLLDLRDPEMGLAAVSNVARTRPSAPIVAVTETEDDAAEARRAGAVAALQPADPTLVDTVGNLVRVFNHPTPQGTFGFAARGGFRSFRRVVFDVQSGLLSATMALNLMHVISESVERAVLFLVQDEKLIACGAFGFSTSGEPLATLTRSLELRSGQHGGFRRALDEAKPQSLDWEEAKIPEQLARLIGKPTSGQVVLFPVLGAERPISLIYTDNGSEEQEIQDIRILELATSQVGVAFENELLRQRLDGLGLDAALELPLIPGEGTA
ncbi:MAG: response regulator [Holophagales bacterium]|nr:response regulator [Holophagales bacterium]